VPQLQDIVGRQLGRRADIEERLKVLSLATGEEPTELTPRSRAIPLRCAS